MLFDLIMDLLTAGDQGEKERAYRRFERMGIDRMCADNMAEEFYKAEGGEIHVEVNGCAH